MAKLVDPQGELDRLSSGAVVLGGVVLVPQWLPAAVHRERERAKGQYSVVLQIEVVASSRIRSGVHQCLLCHCVITSVWNACQINEQDNNNQWVAHNAFTGTSLFLSTHMDPRSLRL
jgi:hypothetical protein